MKAVQVAFAVQHAAGASEPTAAAALLGSLNLPVGQVTEAPSQIVVSASQQAVQVLALFVAEVVQVRPVSVALTFMPGPQLVPAVWNAAHVALAVQHRALVLPVTPFLVESKYMPESHTLVPQELV